MKSSTLAASTGTAKCAPWWTWCTGREAAARRRRFFDEVPGYPAGSRCLYGMMASPRRFAFTIGGIDVTTARSSIEYLKQYRQRMKDIQFIPPVYVDRSPLFENVMEGDDIDLFKFPVPIHHELDGGRYIGTACGVITRDPDSNWINVGTYRIQRPIRKPRCVTYLRGNMGACTATSISNAGKIARLWPSSESIRCCFSRGATSILPERPSWIGWEECAARRWKC